MVIQKVSDLGWVDFYFDDPLILQSHSAHSAYLLSLYQPKQNRADSGKAKSKVILRPAGSPCTYKNLMMKERNQGEPGARNLASVVLN